MDERIIKIIKLLLKEYPNPQTELHYHNNFQLLIAVMLSARCTDKRVNKITPALFAVAPDAYKMAGLPREELERLIFSCGFYREKAESILSASRDICEKFDGKVPECFDDLVSLRGVGRKTANVITSVGFNRPAFAVDTHVFRLANRLRIASAATPSEVEKKLNAVIDEELWNTCHHLFILHGRAVCTSQKPRCDDCAVNGLCPERRIQT